MKKLRYIQPQTTIVLIQAGSHVLTGSPNNFNGNQVILDPENMDGGDGTDAGSRRRHRSVWDDDEEEQGW